VYKRQAVILAGALGQAETARTAKANVDVPAVSSAGEGLATSMARQGTDTTGTEATRSDLGRGPKEHSHGSMAPKGALIGAASVVVFAILAVAANQLLGLS